MALVALTVGFATLGVWVARDWGGAGWFIAWLLSLACLVGLNAAAARGQTGLASGCCSPSACSSAAASRRPSTTTPKATRWPSARRSGRRRCSSGRWGPLDTRCAATSRSCTGCCSGCYSAFLGAGIVLIFVRIPAAYTVWSLAGLVIFGLYTVVDFNRLRRAGKEEAIPLAAGIFLDVLNVFLLFLRLFGRSN